MVIILSELSDLSVAQSERRIENKQDAGERGMISTLSLLDHLSSVRVKFLNFLYQRGQAYLPSSITFDKLPPRQAVRNKWLPAFLLVPTILESVSNFPNKLQFFR